MITLSPSEKQIKLWQIISSFYYLNFLDKNEEWNNYLYDIGITLHLKKPSELDVPSPSGEGILGINSEMAENILNFGMPWRVCDAFKKNA